MNTFGRDLSFKKYLHVLILCFNLHVYEIYTSYMYMIDCMMYSVSWSMLLYFNIVILFNNMVPTIQNKQGAENNYFRPQRAPVFFMTGFIVVRIKLWDKKEKKSPTRYWFIVSISDSIKTDHHFSAHNKAENKERKKVGNQVFQSLTFTIFIQYTVPLFSSCHLPQYTRYLTFSFCKGFFFN